MARKTREIFTEFGQADQHNCIIILSSPIYYNIITTYQKHRQENLCVSLKGQLNRRSIGGRLAI